MYEVVYHPSNFIAEQPSMSFTHLPGCAGNVEDAVTVDGIQSALPTVGRDGQEGKGAEDEKPHESPYRLFLFLQVAPTIMRFIYSDPSSGMLVWHHDVDTTTQQNNRQWARN